MNHLSPHALNHLLIVLRTKHYGRNGPKAKASFKFEENWLLWEDYETVIKEAWSVDVGGMHGMAQLKQKIEVCGVDLREWGSSKSKPNDEEIKQILKQLEIPNVVESTKESRFEYLTVSKKLDGLLLKQEIFWAQRSRTSWLKHGDKSTKFFYSKAS